MSGSFWTEQEVATLRAIYPATPKWQTILRAVPGRSKDAIRNKCISLGIKRDWNSRAAWTGAERATLRKLYPSASWPQICAAIPRHPRPAIGKCANGMKLKRDFVGKQSLFPVIQELRSIRRRRGIKQENLAKRIGIHLVQLRQYESGVANPRLPTFFAWVEASGLALKLVSA